MFPKETYRARRSALRTLLGASGGSYGGPDSGSDGLVFLPGNGDSPRNYRDNAYPFRQDSTFLYLFGLSVQGLDALVDLASGEATLYGDDARMDDIIWTGPLPTMAEMSDMAGAERSASAALLARDLAAARAAGRTVHFLPPYSDAVRLRLSALLCLVPEELDRFASLPLIRAMIALREIKETAEIAELEKAAGVSVRMHSAALRGARAGMSEARVAALATEEALSGGGDLSFPIIATTHGEVLHNHGRAGTLKAGGTLLLDAGAESPEGYAGDLTTTFPIGPRFSDRQRDIYSLLLSVFTTATSLLAPGMLMREVHKAASKTLAEGLVSLGIMKGDPVEAVEQGAHALFFPHGLSHMIGLDVHDMENYGEDLVGYDDDTGPRPAQFGLSSLRLAKRLKPGMVHSVEPGIYFIPGLIGLWRSERRHESFIAYGRLEDWLGVGGMRNEEDWLITDSGARRLGPSFDKSLAAIEAARSGI